MQRKNQRLTNKVSLVAAIFGTMLLGLPAMAQMNQTPANSDRLCSSNMNNMSNSRQGTSAADRNRNTNLDSSDTSASDRNLQGTEEGSSSVNSNRNTPTENSDTTSTTDGDQSNSVSENPSSGTISQQRVTGNRVNNRPTATELDNRDAACRRNPNNVPNNTNNNRDKQIRQTNSNRQMMQRNSSSRIIPPTPEQQQNAIAMVRPNNGAINIRLINETGTNITYEVIGETNQRSLAGESAVNLSTLGTPTTITFYRPDRGLIRVTPQAVAPGVLEVRLAATSVFGTDKNALTVQPSGRVYLN